MATDGPPEHVGRRLSPQPERSWWVGDRLQQRRIRRHTAPEPANVHVAADSGRRPVRERLGEMLRRDRVHLRRAPRRYVRRAPRGLGRVRRAVRVPPRDRATRTQPPFAEGHRRHGVAFAAATTRASDARRGFPGGAASSSARGLGIATTRSKRSSNARDTFSRYAEIRCGLQPQSAAGSPRPPHGQRFIVATRRKRAGKSAWPPTRATETTPSSSGCRSDSSTERENSGSSSSRSTPRCARLASPGRGVAPPPTMAAAEAP